MIRKSAILSIVLLVSAGINAYAAEVNVTDGATILTFDAVVEEGTAAIPEGYGGLLWDESFWLMRNDYLPDNSGYINGRVSLDYVAFNKDAKEVKISGQPFDFIGAYFTAAWRDDLNIEIKGYRDNILVYRQNVIAQTQQPTWIRLDYMNVDSVIFESSGGIKNIMFESDGAHFVMDNMVINEYPVLQDCCVLTFDNIMVEASETIPKQYEGLSWSSCFCVMNKDACSSGSGYANGMISSDCVAYNANAKTIELSGSSFDFIGTYLTAAWREGLMVDIDGYKAGVLVYSETVTINYKKPSWIRLDFLDVDKVRFSSHGGIKNPLFEKDGTHFVMDNMVINKTPMATNSTVLTFEDIVKKDVNDINIPAGYAGLKWSEDFKVRDTAFSAISGFVNSRVTPYFVIYNNDANPVKVSGGQFDFFGAYFTGACRDELNIEINGYRANDLIYSQTVIANAKQPTWIRLDYMNVDRVSFLSYGGVRHDGYANEGPIFIMDNMIINLH